jgi:hypothetical protein
MRLMDLFTRDEPVLDCVSIVFLRQPNGPALRLLSDCLELRRRLFAAQEYLEGGTIKLKTEPHIVVLDLHVVQMSPHVFTFNDNVRPFHRWGRLLCLSVCSVSPFSVAGPPPLSHSPARYLCLCLSCLR